MVYENRSRADGSGAGTARPTDHPALKPLFSKSRNRKRNPIIFGGQSSLLEKPALPDGLGT